MNHLAIENEVEADLLERALRDRIDFSSTYLPPFGPDDDAEEYNDIVQSHRDDADILMVMLARLQLLDY